LEIRVVSEQIFGAVLENAIYFPLYCQFSEIIGIGRFHPVIGHEGP
jgi:hypothetical protein